LPSTASYTQALNPHLLVLFPPAPQLYARSLLTPLVVCPAGPLPLPSLYGMQLVLHTPVLRSSSSLSLSSSRSSLASCSLEPRFSPPPLLTTPTGTASSRYPGPLLLQAPSLLLTSFSSWRFWRGGKQLPSSRKNPPTSPDRRIHPRAPLVSIAYFSSAHLVTFIGGTLPLKNQSSC
jgi:hypothetical protein